MTGLENAQHDLSDAQFSLETAIDLLDSIGHEDTSMPPQLLQVVENLRHIKSELEVSFSQLTQLQQETSH